MLNAYFLFGFFVGIVIGGVLLMIKTIRSKKVSGDLIVDTADEEPYLFLELSDGIDKLWKKRYIYLKVVKKNFSRK